MQGIRSGGRERERERERCCDPLVLERVKMLLKSGFTLCNRELLSCSSSCSASEESSLSSAADSNACEGADNALRFSVSWD